MDSLPCKYDFIKCPCMRVVQVKCKMLLDKDRLSEAAAAGDPKASIAPIEVNNDPEISFRSPFEYIYTRYDQRPETQASDENKRDDTSRRRSKTPLFKRLVHVGGIQNRPTNRRG